jgi:hypothetical protein
MFQSPSLDTLVKKNDGELVKQFVFKKKQEAERQKHIPDK